MKNARLAPNASTLAQDGSSGIYSIRSLLRLSVCASLVLLSAGCSTLTAISVSETGEWANNDSRGIDVSADGRFVVFSSAATNLDPECDSYPQESVYLRDTLNNTIDVVNTLYSLCGPAPGYAHSPAVSASEGNSWSTIAFVTKRMSGAYFASAFDRVFVRDHTSDGALTPIAEHCVPNVNYDSHVILDLANGPCVEPDLSADGDRLVYSSTASNLLISGGNSNSDVYISNAAARQGYPGKTFAVLVSLSVTGGASNGDSHSPSVSGDGRYVAFASTATDLVLSDTNNAQDIFVRDMESQVIRRVSIGAGFFQANGDSYDPVISADGRYVAFTSRANNLRPEDPFGEPDVYVYDRFLQTTKLVSVDLPGPVRLYQAGAASISGDGRFISFDSYGPLASNDTNSLLDVYMRDMQKGITKRISEGTSAEQGSAGSSTGVMSDDGRYVAFLSNAEDLYSGDDNGFRDVYMKSAIEPTVDSISHRFLHRGDTTSVTITGSYFMPGSVPAIDHTTISNVVIVDENTITADVTVDDVVVYDTYDVSVYLYASGPSASRGSSAGVCSDCVSLF